MAVELIQVRNVGLKITESVKIPVIQAIISGEPATSNEMKSLYEQILPLCQNMVCLCAPQSLGYDFSDIPVTISYGDTSGFSLTQTRYTPTPYGIYHTTIKYKNKYLGRIWNYTGYATYTAAFFILFTDETNKLYSFATESSKIGLYLLSNAIAPTLYVDANDLVTGLVYGFTAVHNPSTSFSICTLTDEDISDYLTIPYVDPYSGDGTSTTGGGGGTGDYSYDIIDRPTYDATEEVKRGYINRGYIEVFNPTETELINFRTYLFSGTNPLDNPFVSLNRMFNSPIDVIVSLSLLPYAPTIGSNKEDIYIGNLQSGITAYKVTNQFLTIDWGDLDIPKATRSFNDFSPFTKAEIYLPYIGVREIEIDKIVGYNVTLHYYIDVVSGDFIATLAANGDIDAGTPQYEPMIDSGVQSGVLYQWAGNCALHIPVTAAYYASQLAGTLGLIGTIGGTIAGIATGGAVAPIAAAGISGALSSAAQLSKNPIQHSGSIPSMAGWLSVQVPYIMLSRPRLNIPENNGTFVGYPTDVTYVLADVTGYTEIKLVHLENIPATQAEKDEIEKLLQNGVLL